MQIALAPQIPGVARAFAHGFAAFEHDRPESHLREHQGREQSARAEADHERPQRQCCRCLGDHAIAGIGGHADMRIVFAARKHRGLVAQGHVERIDKQDCAALARVIAALGDLQRQQLRVGDRQFAQHGLAQRRLGMVQRQFDIGQSQHRSASFAPHRRRRGRARVRSQSRELSRICAALRMQAAEIAVVAARSKSAHSVAPESAPRTDFR